MFYSLFSLFLFILDSVGCWLIWKVGRVRKSQIVEMGGSMCSTQHLSCLISRHSTVRNAVCWFSKIEKNNKVLALPTGDSQSTIRDVYRCYWPFFIRPPPAVPRCRFHLNKQTTLGAKKMKWRRSRSMLYIFLRHELLIISSKQWDSRKRRGKNGTLMLSRYGPYSLTWKKKNLLLLSDRWKLPAFNLTPLSFPLTVCPSSLDSVHFFFFTMAFIKNSNEFKLSKCASSLVVILLPSTLIIIHANATAARPAAAFCWQGRSLHPLIWHSLFSRLMRSCDETHQSASYCLLFFLLFLLIFVSFWPFVARLDRRALVASEPLAQCRMSTQMHTRAPPSFFD